MTSGDDLVERLKTRAKKKRDFVAHAEAERDGWFATMPPEVSAEAIADAELDEQAAREIALLREALKEVTECKHSASFIIEYIAKPALARSVLNTERK